MSTISLYKEMNFGLGETADMIRDHVNSFSSQEIAPLAGDTNITTSLYLSQKTGLPHFTKSPSLTSNFGVKFGKSEGFKAKDLDKLPSAIILLGTPFILISRPFLTVIFINDEN